MADVKLFQPQRLTDNPDGGGLATANEVVDGQINNLLPDISRIDRVNGEISLRETFVIAATDDTALFSDVFLTVQAPPLDPRVSAVLFRLKKDGNYVWNGLRDDATNPVERYLDPSVISRMVLYDRQLSGGRAILAFQRPELSLPEIGQVYALSDDGTGDQEFFRIQDLDHEVQTFTDTQGDYSVRVITMTIDQPLQRDWVGSQPNRYFTAQNARCIRKTIANDAARYKGVVKLANDAAIGDFSVKVEGIFAQLVPSATGEAAVTDAVPAGVSALVASATATFTKNLGSPAFDFQNWYVPTGIVPGSGQILGVATATDDGAGGLVPNSAYFRPGGTIDYERGIFNFGVTFVGGNSATYMPAATVSKSAQSMLIPVEVANRGYVYTANLPILPEPGSMVLSYRAQGHWYELRDDGTGALRGEDAAFGSGLISYATGSWSATLGALPDVDSAIIVAWGGGSEYEIRTGDVDIQPPAIAFTVAAGNIEPGTFSCSWTANGVTKTATANSAGVLSGDGTGKVVHSSGDVLLYPTVLADPFTQVVCAYQRGDTDQALFYPTKTAGSVSLDLGEALAEGSVRIDYIGYGPDMAQYGGGGSHKTRTLVDDGAGGLKDTADGTSVAGASVNYSTGIIAFPPDWVTKIGSMQHGGYSTVIPGRVVDPITGAYTQGGIFGSWPMSIKSLTALATFITGEPMNVTWKADSTSNSSVTGEPHDIDNVVLDLTPNAKGSIVPGSVLFTFGGKTYYDRSGTLYHSLDSSTGAGTLAGNVDYAGGIAQLSAWAANVAPGLSIKSLLVEVAALPQAYVYGRTPGAPLRPGSFSIRAARYRDSAVVSATADNNGNLDASGIHGTIDVNTGVFVVGFGAYVLDSSLSADDKALPWYDAANVAGDGYIWRPDEVIPGTVKFNCVVQTALPLDPEIIKINPVRLPSDGRVPIIRPGDTAVLRDAQVYTFTDDTLSAAQVVTLPRTGLSVVSLYDANGLGVPDGKFSADLAAGTVTMADPLDLTGYVQPLAAVHEILEMQLVLDAQINGQVTFGQALAHAFDADNAMLSTALVLGDAQARYEHLFAQQTWTNVWSDALIGNAPPSGAKYNDLAYPLDMVNKDAITQRWALIFTSSTAFNIVGEELGIVGTGNTSTNLAPISPATGQPYFSMAAAGFGTGWSTGNVIRFNTVAAGAPIWIARTVLSGPATVLDDRIRLQLGWDKD